MVILFLYDFVVIVIDTKSVSFLHLTVEIWRLEENFLCFSLLLNYATKLLHNALLNCL